MSNDPLVMNEFDYRRLRGLLALLRERGSGESRSQDALKAKLLRARVVPADRLPTDAVSMNAEFWLRDLDTSERVHGRLVFPASAGSGVSGISVLSPLGAEVFGCREAEPFQVATPEGTRRYVVERVSYQPEASGHHAL